jgi:hypothetical protein
MIRSASPLNVPPDGVRDVQLWWFGRSLADRHRAMDDRGGCAEVLCRAGGRCWVRPVAQRLMAASRGSWPQRWTARLDAGSCGLPVPDASSGSTATGDGPVHRGGRGVLAGVR